MFQLLLLLPLTFSVRKQLASMREMVRSERQFDGTIVAAGSLVLPIAAVVTDVTVADVVVLVVTAHFLSIVDNYCCGGVGGCCCGCCGWLLVVLVVLRPCDAGALRCGVGCSCFSLRTKKTHHLHFNMARTSHEECAHKQFPRMKQINGTCGATICKCQ